MKPLRFALAFHNHQPVGNNDSIIERIYRRSYLPFLKALASHPEIKANLHYTGFLLEWLEANHPEFITLLQELVKNGQVEMLGGAYYEPVLAVIPDSDAIGQIDLLSRKIHSLFGVLPDGIWIAERAWEPHLPEVLSKAHVEFTMLDDTIFRSTGLSASSCFAPYTVESRGSSVTVLPIQKRLRYSMPFKPVASTISFLRKAHDEGKEIALFADDGEKFGAWPTTFERVFTEGWLDEFFNSLRREQKTGTVETVRLSEYLNDNHPRNKIYLPSAAYPEMMEWSLVLDDSERSERHGFFRLFLAKYPESARLYSKMLWTSKLIHSVRNRSAMIELWKGECNDAYWHGVFGGLYAPLLRKTTYEHLIRAQVISERSFGNRRWISCEKSDNQILINTRELGVTISPSRGGSITELDFKPNCVNVFDTLARRPEKYHGQLELQKRASGKNTVRSIHDAPRATEKGLEKLLSYDRYERNSFLDFLVDSETDQDSFTCQDFKEVAPFADLYNSRIMRRSDSTKVILSRTAQSSLGSISLEKTLEVSADSSQISITYSIVSSHPLCCKFVPELNLGCLADSKFGREHHHAMSTSSGFVDVKYPETGIRAVLRVPKTSKIATIPIWTVSQSEKGFEKNLQGVSIHPFYDINIGIDERFQTEMSFEVRKLR
ncbi:MAG: alpha-amylase/4-alpha-glucanotransferase domain-containing protein [Nitrososphaerales archaeon]